MTSRQQYIESIIESVYAIRRKLMVCGSAKVSVRRPQKEHSITHSQWAVLAVVIRLKHAGIKEIAEALNMTSSAATQLVDELVKKEYLLRKGDAKDRRALSLTLSDMCKTQMNELKSKRIERFITIFDGLNDKELAQYASLNKKIASGILNKDKQDR